MACGIAFVLALLVWAVVASVSQSPKRRNRKQIKEAELFFRRMATGGILSVPTSIVLDRDERASYCESVVLFEEKTSRAYVGMGTRIKGIYVGSGRSRSFAHLSKVDAGTLTLTNKKIVFIGHMESRVTDTKSITSVDRIAIDAFQLTTKGRSRNQIYTVQNPYIWVMLVKNLVSGLIHTVSKASTPPPLPNR
jgi:hypothetical protein